MSSYAATHKVNHTKTLIVVFSLLAMMVSLVVASESLYRIFCQVTGYGGTPQKAEASDGTILAREMTIRFNSDVNNQLPWHFKPVQRAVTVKIGEEALIFYKAVNNSDQTITG
ncbi:MAG: cytochrome c oxidase assembly protein, partial [Emcibacter sp.]|nr:cytochrome c oxidase assembly protein [Emcibacter sp.]